MAAEWTPGTEGGAGSGKPTEASSGKTGPFAVSGGEGRQGTKGTPGTQETEGVQGVQLRDPYAAGLVQGVRPEEQRQVLRREAQRLTAVSAAHSREINLRRREKHLDADPEIQGGLGLIRGTDKAYGRNGEKPLPGTLNGLKLCYP